MMKYGLAKNAKPMRKISEDNLKYQLQDMTYFVVLYQKTTVILKTCVQKRVALIMKPQKNARNETCGFAQEKNFKIARVV